MDHYEWINMMADGDARVQEDVFNYQIENEKLRAENGRLKRELERFKKRQWRMGNRRV